MINKQLYKINILYSRGDNRQIFISKLCCFYNIVLYQPHTKHYLIIVY